MKKTKEKKFVTVGLKISKVFAVMALFYCSWILYIFGSRIVAGLILLILCLFMIFNQLDALNKK